MFLGRIITNNKNLEKINFVDITNDVNSIDNTIPTLIISKKLTEDIYGKDKISYLDKRISDNVWWTFGKMERRNEYERDLDKFKSLIKNNIKKDIKYRYINIFTEPLSTIKKLISFIDNNNEKIIYINDKHIFIYFNKNIIGLSLSDISYVGISKDKIIKRLSKNILNTIITDDTFLNKSLKKLVEGNKMLIPYIYFLSKK